MRRRKRGYSGDDDGGCGEERVVEEGGEGREEGARNHSVVILRACLRGKNVDIK